MKGPRFYILLAVIILLILGGIGSLLLLRNTDDAETTNKEAVNQETECINHGEVLQVVDDYECCSGLTEETFCFFEESEGQCSCPSEGTKLCINCGNGECGPGEDECMCPEDCN
jgi:hypothetical protein